MNYIHSIIETAYTNYFLVQQHSEYFKFCEWYQELRCKNIMEIGSYLGGNFYCMCKLSDPNGLKISIDCPLYQNQSEELNPYDTYRKMKTFAGNVRIINTDSHSDSTVKMVKSILENEKLDFLFIDGDHTYEGVKQDFEMYSPFVKKGGYITFHDINDTEYHRNIGIYVNKLWNELNYENKFEFNSKSHCMGIGVIQI